ncbi:MAG TPA: aromatic ring-hydroxylating dioxygenase subunit alpha [Acidimicrobiales bacterium]
MTAVDMGPDLARRFRLRTPDEGPALVPKGRYLEESFADLERQLLWPRVWQLACLTTDLAAPGDWVEYRIAEQSYIVLRDLEGDVRAFHNVCPHRGFTLCEGAGSCDDGVLRCGFHGWRFDLDGAVREISSQASFGRIRRADYGLRPVRIGVWGQLVFINPHPDGPDLSEFLDPIPQDLAPFELEKRLCTSRFTITMPGNWKVTVDAFNEAYHLQGLHPTLIPFMDDVHTTFRVFERGHSMMQLPLGVASPRLAPSTEQQVAEAFHAAYPSMLGARPEDGPDLAGGTARQYAIDRIRQRCAAGGVDLSALGDAQVIDDFHYLAFPNLVFNVHAEANWIFRARPGTHPGTSLFDFFQFNRLADGVAKGPQDHVVFPEGARIAEVIDQDLDGIGRVHAGMRSGAFEAVSLGRLECRLVAMHSELDRLLGLV